MDETELRDPPQRWRSRDAAERLFNALCNQYMLPYWPAWVLEIKRSKHKRNKNPSVLIVCRDGTYGIKALRNAFIARKYRESHPDSEAIEIAILPTDPLSEIRKRVFGMIDSMQQRKRAGTFRKRSSL